MIQPIMPPTKARTTNSNGEGVGHCILSYLHSFLSAIWSGTQTGGQGPDCTVRLWFLSISALIFIHSIYSRGFDTGGGLVGRF